jgi:hypothetical protein
VPKIESQGVRPVHQDFSQIAGSVNPKRPKVEPIRQPTLFEMEKVEKTAELTSKSEVERPFSLSGTKIFSKSWQLDGMKE